MPAQAQSPETGETPSTATVPPTVQTTAETSEPAGQTPEPFDQTRAMETIRKQRDAEKAARDAAKAAEARAKELEAELKQYKDAQLSDEERRAKREEATQTALAQSEAERAARELELQDLRTQRAVERAALVALKDDKDQVVRPPFIDPEAAYQLIDRATLEFDDNGTPTAESVTSALDALAKSKPYLLTQPATQAAASNTPSNPARANGNQAAGETDAERRARLTGAGPSVFNPEAARKGGGVVWSNPPTG